MENDMIIYSGEALRNHTEKMLEGIKKERFISEALKKYITGPNNRRVCCLYGLRRTGKTTMMFQQIRDNCGYDNTLFIECVNGSTVM